MNIYILFENYIIGVIPIFPKESLNSPLLFEIIILSLFIKLFIYLNNFSIPSAKEWNHLIVGKLI